MRQEEQSERFTVILVPDRTSRVRRFQVPKRLVRRALWVAVGVAGLLVAGFADYVRLRLDAIDVERLRAESAEQRQELARFADEMTDLRERLATLRELERKVRIIANLPGGPTEDEAAAESHPHGRGGGVEGDDPDAPSAELPPTSAVAPEDLAPKLLEPTAADGLPSFWPRPEVVARLRTRAGTFREAALHREASLEDLIQGLHGKSRQLASTPSIWPSRGWVTSGFGRRISPFTGRPQFHGGIDIAASFGTEVVAPGRGRVVFVGRKGALGRTVVVDHGYGIQTTYGHLGDVLVRKGQEVERGEPIGRIGSSGRTTGPHLHYSVAVRGKAVNPVDYIFE